MTADNRESYETVSWILDNADTGFFIVTAPHNMQRNLAELYKTSKVEIYVEYRNGERWHDLHPLVAEFLIKQGVIEDDSR